MLCIARLQNDGLDHPRNLQTGHGAQPFLHFSGDARMRGQKRGRVKSFHGLLGVKTTKDSEEFLDVETYPPQPCGSTKWHVDQAKSAETIRM